MLPSPQCRGAPAPYAADPARSRGRLVAEPPPANRSAFQRDRDRILHCSAFRRLSGKTQVLHTGEGDYFRTRLTHSLEVAQVARSLARQLGLDEDLTEALALAHDLGHGPFGHTGEDALDRSMRRFGGFDHNLQTLRVVVELEARYLDFDGLNLSWEVLEGLAKRGGPVATPSALLAGYDRMLNLELDRRPSAEAQVAAVSDDIAYNAHDLEDALRAGLIAPEDACAVPVVREVRDWVRPRAGGAADPLRLPFALSRGLVDVFVRDVLEESGRRLAADAPADVDALRGLTRPMVALSDAGAEASRALKSFLFARVYRHPRLVEVRARASSLVGALTDRLLADPAAMPGRWGGLAARADDPARCVADYVSGMTDRFAIGEHARLFDGPSSFG